MGIIPQDTFFNILLSAFKDNFSDHNTDVCSLSKLKYAQKPCFHHPKIIPYWGLTYLLGFFFAYIFNIKLK